MRKARFLPWAKLRDLLEMAAAAFEAEISAVFRQNFFDDGGQHPRPQRSRQEVGEVLVITLDTAIGQLDQEIHLLTNTTTRLDRGHGQGKNVTCYRT